MLLLPRVPRLGFTPSLQEDFSWHPLSTCENALEQFRYACFTHPEHSLKGRPPSLETGTYSFVLSIIHDDWDLLLLSRTTTRNSENHTERITLHSYSDIRNYAEKLEKKTYVSVFGCSLLLFGSNPNDFRVRVFARLLLTLCRMPTRKLSRDLKAQIQDLFHQGFKIKDICAILGVKKTVVYQTLRYVRAYGIPYNPHAHSTGGRKRVLSQADITFIVALLNRRHSIYVDEIQEQLSNERGTVVSIATLLRTLRRLHYSHKVVSVRALERDDILRSAFMNKIADEVTNPDMLMFVDEAARNKRTSARAKGWSSVGKRCVQRTCFGRGQRFSILPILTLDGIITYDIIPGSVTSDRFLQFLREMVVRISIYAFI